MQTPHIERMVTEKSDLELKLGRLEAFVDGAVFKTLADLEQSDLLLQFAAMSTYAEVLERRVKRALNST